MTPTEKRELLELAALAAGVKHNPSLSAACRGERAFWNPIDDDGDALRLAVRLGLAVSVEYQVGSTTVLWGPPMNNVREPHGCDPYAATRLAITRAAAEIGKNMAMSKYIEGVATWGSLD